MSSLNGFQIRTLLYITSASKNIWITVHICYTNEFQNDDQGLIRYWVRLRKLGLFQHVTKIPNSSPKLFIAFYHNTHRKTPLEPKIDLGFGRVYFWTFIQFLSPTLYNQLYKNGDTLDQNYGPFNHIGKLYTV